MQTALMQAARLSLVMFTPGNSQKFSASGSRVERRPIGGGQERDFEVSVGSTRLANVRDGIEDYDMISLLRLLDPAAAAEAVALFSDGSCAPCV
jgi:hypothetical protein